MFEVEKEITDANTVGPVISTTLERIIDRIEPEKSIAIEVDRIQGPRRGHAKTAATLDDDRKAIRGANASRCVYSGLLKYRLGNLSARNKP